MSEALRLLECQDASEYLSNRLSQKPKTAIITGTGLSGITSHMEVKEVIPYLDIPNMPTTSVSSHEPHIKLVEINGKPVVIFCGRFHYYEGYSMYEVVFPVRICQFMGIESIILTNAAGGLHKEYRTPEIVVISDHLYFLPDHPLRGLKDEEWGNRFPDLKSVYDLELRGRARSAFQNQGRVLKEGVYACMMGPSLETRAELHYLKSIGADLVGMSTIPEVLAAAQAGLRILALSVVTNIVDPDEPMDEVTLQDVIEVSKLSLEPLSEVIKATV
ncbi:MAG: purine-nucleoside phosphorylase [Saprospiraceae bacterium]|nr:purine-nucleoside phosphorylase [Saprospiraceae bacterium]